MVATSIAGWMLIEKLVLLNKIDNLSVLVNRCIYSTKLMILILPGEFIVLSCVSIALSAFVPYYEYIKFYNNVDEKYNDKFKGEV